MPLDINTYAYHSQGRNVQIYFSNFISEAPDQGKDATHFCENP